MNDLISILKAVRSIAKRMQEGENLRLKQDYGYICLGLVLQGLNLAINQFEEYEKFINQSFWTKEDEK